MTDADPTPVRPRTRRGLLLGALAGLGALAADAATRAAPARAAAGDPLVLGSVNSAGTSATTLNTASATTALAVVQSGAAAAVSGNAAASGGATKGVYGVAASPSGDGVRALNTGAAGSGAGLRALGGNNPGVIATSTGGIAVTATSNSNIGLTAKSTLGVGLSAEGGTHAIKASAPIHAVWAISSESTAVYGDGVVGVMGGGTATGVYGAGNSFGVYGSAPVGSSRYAVFAFGDMRVTGTLLKAAGSFQIDHPLDPDRKWLSHSFVESPDMMNVYNGVAVLGAGGEATVTLPAWFEALNRDFRYQLTAMGRSMPGLHVSREVADNAFRIGGGEPGGRVSWQVTGIRHDDYAREHPIVVETDKSPSETGARQFVPRGSSARQMDWRSHAAPQTS